LFFMQRNLRNLRNLWMISLSRKTSEPMR
jgi:hypothetical protein